MRQPKYLSSDIGRVARDLLFQGFAKQRTVAPPGSQRIAERKENQVRSWLGHVRKTPATFVCQVDSGKNHDTRHEHA